MLRSCQKVTCIVAGEVQDVLERKLEDVANLHLKQQDTCGSGANSVNGQLQIFFCLVLTLCSILCA